MSPNKENAQTIDKEINMSKNNLTKKLNKQPVKEHTFIG